MMPSRKRKKSELPSPDPHRKRNATAPASSSSTPSTKPTHPTSDSTVRQPKSASTSPPPGHQLPQQELCEACQPMLQMERGGFDEVLHLGSPHEIAQRKDCCLCRLVTHLLSPIVDHGTETHESIVLDPRLLDGYLGVFSDWTKAGGLPARALGWIQVKNSAEQPDFPSNCVLSEVDPTQIVSWMKECSRDHGSTCDQLLVTRPIQDLLLIDVHAEKLVAVEQHCKYVALSYVWGGWGGNEPTGPTKNNVDSLKTSGALRAPHIKVPSVVRDAMELCRKIGQSFLWCDLFCIINDCHATKHIQIQQMDAIYNRAHLTIVALTGTHGDTPLPGVLDGSRPPICRTERLRSGILLVSRAPCLISALAGTVYGTRGWTYQESMLSKRLLYMTHRQMYFDCQMMCAREDEKLECFPRPDSDNRADVFVYRRLNSLGALLQDPRWDMFSNYSTFVYNYTVRELSYASDKINAFEGIAQVLKSRFETDMWAGLPTSHLDKALLWRQGWKNRYDQESTKSFPSWSWASRTQSIYYAFPHDGLPDIDFRVDTKSAPQTVQCASVYYLSSLVGKDELLDIRPGFLESSGRVLIHQSVEAVHDADPQSAWRACKRSDTRSSFYFSLEYVLPTLTVLAKVLSASGVNPWKQGPLTGTAILEFSDKLHRNSAFSRTRQIDHRISDTELGHVLTLLGKCLPDGPLRLPEWPFKDFNAARWGDNVDPTWPFGEPLSLAYVESYLESSDDFFRDLSEFRHGILRGPDILSFWTSAVSDLQPFSMLHGQLFRESTHFSWRKTTQNGRHSCNTLTLEFWEDDQRLANERNMAWPATMLFDSSGDPCGVLYDFESRITRRIGDIQRCSFVFISRMQQPEGDKDWDLLNFLLVEEKEGYTFERIVAGCIVATTPGLESAQPKYIRLV